MNARKKTLRAVGFTLFWLGTLTAMALAAAGTIADLEAAFYGFPWWAEKSLPGFRCPVLMTSGETGTVSLTLKNPTDRTIPFRAHADISTPGQARQVPVHVEVAPGEKRRIDWTVTSADVDLGFFIFVNGWTNPAYPYPYRQSMCGILVLNWPGLTGKQIFALTLAASVLCMAGGMGMWIASNKLLEGSRRSATACMGFLALAVLAALLVSIVGAWMAGIILLAIAVLTVTALVYVVLTD